MFLVTGALLCTFYHTTHAQARKGGLSVLGLLLLCLWVILMRGFSILKHALSWQHSRREIQVCLQPYHVTSAQELSLCCA